MAGNSIGQLFRLTTAGESHGEYLIGILDGVPPGITLNVEKDIMPDMLRRRPGYSKFTSKRRELDQVEIVSGVFNGKTTGTPLTLIVKNNDVRSQDYSAISEKFRPGHADFTYLKKYGIRDHRGGGRSSARETTMRVAAGAIAKKILLESYNIEIYAFISQIGNIKINFDWELIKQTHPENLFLPNDEQLDEVKKLLDQILKDGDSIGAKVNCIAKNVPIGLGEPVFDKLDADLAHSLMSINAAKAVAIGDGFDAVNLKGSESRDALGINGFESNHSGGILGGISNGENIQLSVAFKSTPSIKIPIKTLDYDGNETLISVQGRHDPCVGIRAVPIVESMVSIIILDHLMRNNAQCRLTLDVNDLKI